ncbi:hypothetical protein [Lysobacter terrae]
MRIFALLVLLLIATPAMAQDLQVRVHPSTVKETDFCSNCTPGNVHTSYWTIYKAKVNRVIKGRLDKKVIRFAFAQHAQYTPEALNNLVVYLRPASPWLQTQFQVD